MKTSSKLIIFEGPDGAGKTTLAKAVAEDLGALYTHLGPFPRVKRGLARLYVEAMLPAVLGYSDVVLDRCWISEPIYGKVHRDGADRLGVARTRVLERLAMRCETTVICCLPSREMVHVNFKIRKDEEYLNGVAELNEVYDIYNHNLKTSLPFFCIDPFRSEVNAAIVISEAHRRASLPHPLKNKTAGSAAASIMIVGEGFGDPADGDPLYPWPFGSLENMGCSLWLADQLEDAGIGENSLFWVNADALEEHMINAHNSVIALGNVANEKLNQLGCRRHHAVPHPQYWKRFHHNDPYPLINIIRDISA